MDDLRQKLFPIFLKEAEVNLAALRKFLGYENLATASADDLETAFRAAHTLKGTANLVQAESICKISRRLEAMLEKHFIARTNPTPVEHEAMQLAVDWLAPLVSALQGDLQEPKLFVAEALQALDLAEAFPGRTPLIELLDSSSEQRSPHLDDPFDGDPEVLPEEGAILRAAKDPFAEDPSFANAISLDSTDDEGDEETLLEDPFADDHDYSASELQPDSANDSVLTEEPVSAATELPHDPFAEDDLVLAVDAEVAGQPSAEAGTANPPGADKQEAPADTAPVMIDDPFAEDEDFVTAPPSDNLLQSKPESDSPLTQSVTARAEKIAASLLLPQQDNVPRRDYFCCVFSIGGHDYHLPIKQMQEIADLPPLLPLPLAPPMVSGLVNLRGRVMPVINLATLNQHQQSEVRVQRRLVIAEYQNDSLAFLADGVPYLSEDFIGEKIDMSKFLSLHRLRGVEV